MFDKGPQANQQLFTNPQIFFQSHPGARPVVQIAAVDGGIGEWRRRGGAFYPGSLRLQYSPRHGTDHDSKPLPSLPGICLPSCPVQSGPQEHRSLRAAAQGLGRHLLALPSAGPGYDQLAERRFEFIPLWGFFVFLLYAMRRVDCRRCGVVIVSI